MLPKMPDTAKETGGAWRIAAMEARTTSEDMMVVVGRRYQESGFPAKRVTEDIQRVVEVCRVDM